MLVKGQASRLYLHLKYQEQLLGTASVQRRQFIREKSVKEAVRSTWNKLLLKLTTVNYLRCWSCDVFVQQFTPPELSKHHVTFKQLQKASGVKFEEWKSAVLKHTMLRKLFTKQKNVTASSGFSLQLNSTAFLSRRWKRRDDATKSSTFTAKWWSCIKDLQL